MTTQMSNTEVKPNQNKKPNQKPAQRPAQRSEQRPAQRQATRPEQKPVQKTAQNPAQKPVQKKRTTKQSRLARDKKNMKILNKIRHAIRGSAGFMFALFINVLIVYALIKMFTYSFHFGYGLFGKVAKSPASKQYVVVNIPPDSTALQIGEALEKADIIEDKYIFFAKIKIKKLGGKLTSGEFHLSASMNYDEIIDVLCPPDEDEEGGGSSATGQKRNSGEVTDTGTIDPADLTTEATTEEGEDAEGEGGEEGEGESGEGDAGEAGEAGDGETW